MNELTPDQALTWLPRLLLNRWRRLSARARHAVWVAVGVPTVLLLSSAPAYADGSTAPAALSWIKVEDSHGVSIWQYEMSLDRGGVRNPVRAVWAIFVDLGWQIYRGYIALACWLIDWTLSMDWIGWVATPVMNLGDGLHEVVARFGATTALLTITAMAAVLWMARGRWVLGIFELFMSLVIASLAVGILSNPVRLVAGDDGMLMNSRDVGMSIAAGLQDGGSTDTSSEQLRHQVTGLIAETFLRKPQQLVNFGEVIDGTACEKEYDETITQGPFGDEDDLRDAMGDCKEELGEVAENPNSGMAMSLGVLMPAGFVVVAFAALLCGVVLVAGIYALYQSLKMIVALILALLPGGARGSLWMTFAELIISMVTIVFSVVFLAAYVLLIESVFETESSPMATFFIVDVLLLVGIVVFWKGRKRIKAATERLATAMSKRPGGGGPTALPQKQRLNYADAYYKTRLATQGAAAAGRTAAAAGKVTGTAVAGTGKFAGRSAYAPVDRAVGRIGFAMAAARASGEQGAEHGQDPGAQLNERLALPRRGNRKGQLVRAASTVGLAVATGGASTLVATGARTVGKQAVRQGVQQAAISGARRAALNGRLRPAALPPGPTRSVPTAPNTHSAAPKNHPANAPRPTRAAPVRDVAPKATSTPQPPTVVQGQILPTPSKAAAAIKRHPEHKPGVTRPDVNAEDQLRARLAARRPIALGPVTKPRPGKW